MTVLDFPGLNKVIFDNRRFNIGFDITVTFREGISAQWKQL